MLADCRARLATDVIGGRWVMVVLHALRDGPVRPADLLGRIGGIRSKVLNETLRKLRDDGLVDRRAYREAPPRVVYELTDLGRSLLVPLDALARWADLHGDEVVEAQERASVDRSGAT